MNERQKRFVEAYLIDPNARRAAEATGIELGTTGSGFYVYLLCDSRDGQIFYVGKGKGKRMLSHCQNPKSLQKKNPLKAERIKEILAAGATVEALSFANDLSEKEAFHLERSLILALGRRGLVNRNLARSCNLSARQDKFVKLYDGNGTKTAKLAGYQGSDNTLAQTAHELLRNPKVSAAIRERQEAQIAPHIATREARQKFWTDIMNDEFADMRDRLRASELLGKTEGDFIERIVHSDEGEKAPLYILSFPTNGTETDD